MKVDGSTVIIVALVSFVYLFTFQSVPKGNEELLKTVLTAIISLAAGVGVGMHIQKPQNGDDALKKL